MTLRFWLYKQTENEEWKFKNEDGGNGIERKKGISYGLYFHFRELKIKI